MVLCLPPVEEEDERVHRGAGSAPDTGIRSGKRAAVHDHEHAGGSPGSGHRSETGGADGTGSVSSQDRVRLSEQTEQAEQGHREDGMV